jgi:hypothetical protein
MPLSDSALSALLQSQIKSIPAVDVVDDAVFKGHCDALAAAIVTHIVTSAVVTVPVTSGSSAGVYMGTIA